VASANLRDVMERVNRGEGTVGGLMTDPAIYNDLRSLFGRANRNKLLKAVVRSTLEKNDNQ
jgi:phospholipid/cholesterol/gamma-HCH transport system substrate-binding protein